MPNIRVDDDVYGFLKEHAEPFTDSPNSVLRRLLRIDGKAKVSDVVEPTKASSTVRRRTKDSTGRKRKQKGRARRGSLLPEEAYMAPILEALAECGGVGRTSDVIDRVGAKLETQLTPLDKEMLPSGQFRWKNRAQFVRFRLVEEGLMGRDSGRGTWVITDEGRSRVNGGVINHG